MSVGLNPRDDIEKFFHPNGVALIGHVDRRSSADQLRKALVDRWGEPFYLVSNSGGSIGGIPVYRHIADVPDPVDLAVVSVRREFVPEVARDCAARGVRNLLVFTAGFSEVDDEGAELEQELRDVRDSYDLCILGPNTNTNAFERVPVPIVPGSPKIALITQSGHVGRGIIQGSDFGLAFSRWVPTGNELDLDVADFIEYFAYDSDTSAIACYVEGFRDGPRLRKSLRAAAEKGKPVIILKIGRSKIGSSAAASHTAHLSGSDAIVDGLFRQYSVQRVSDLDELAEVSALRAKFRTLAGPRIAIYGVSGGTCALSAEIAELAGLSVPRLSESTQKMLHEVIPSYLSVRNPVDNGGDLIMTATAEQRQHILDLIVTDPSIDMLAVVSTGIVPILTENLISDAVTYAVNSPKPIVVVWTPWQTNVPAFHDLVISGVPFFRSLSGAFRALAGTVMQSRLHNGATERPIATRRFEMSGHERLVLSQVETRAFLRSAAIPLVQAEFASSEEQIRAACSALNAFPLVVKAATSAEAHKSDLNLVRLGIDSEAAALEAFRAIRLTLRDLGHDASEPLVQVQPQIEGGHEIIVGIVRDDVLGPAIMVGMGGIFAEVLNDVSVRPVPVTPKDIVEMLSELRGHAVLSGMRGTARADLESIYSLVGRVAQLAEDHGDLLVELDLNPVIVGSTGAIAVDALAIVEPYAWSAYTTTHRIAGLPAAKGLHESGIEPHGSRAGP
jgi:acetate---CoA ligase (ADP-forming)